MWVWARETGQGGGEGGRKKKEEELEPPPLQRHDVSCGYRYARILHMASANQPRVSVDAVNPWTATDVAAILRERGWLTTDPTPEVDAWGAHAAAILGAHAADRAEDGRASCRERVEISVVAGSLKKKKPRTARCAT